MTFRALTLLLGLLLAGPSLASDLSGVGLDPSLRLLLAKSDSELQQAFAAAESERGRLPVPLSAASAFSGDTFEILVEASDALLMSREGLEVIPLSGGIYAARSTLPALRELVANEEILSARLSRPVYPNLDRSTEYLDLRDIRRLNRQTGTFTGSTGRGVTVGIVDSGVDWSHPDFDRSDGSTRIFRYWDQAQPFPTNKPEGFPFGQEYRDVSIDRGTAGGKDRDGHGSHVLGIAAGSGRASFIPGESVPYAGVAPEASLIVVRTVFTEFGVTSGAQYIWDRTDMLGQPVVLNLSLGNHFGPHRGTTLFERALDNMVEPGKLIVAAAGNDGGGGIHAEMVLAEGETQTLEFDVPDYVKDPRRFVFMDFEGWFDIRNRYRFTMISPQGDEVGSYVHGDLNREYVDVKGFVRAWYTDDLGMGTLTMEVMDDSDSPRRATGRWKMRVEALEVPGDPGMDFWMVSWAGNGGTGYPSFATHVDREETIVSPATASSIIAAGAMSTRACWPSTTDQELCYASQPGHGDIAYFSAMGPTPDGKNKPEILAPGFGVVSVRSSNISMGAHPEEELDRLSTPDGNYWLNQGTSMSSPHVAGTVALLLEKHPELTYEQAVSRLVARGRKVEDSRNGAVVTLMSAGGTVAPPVEVTFAELTPEKTGLRLSWFVGKQRSPAEYRVHKGFSEDGPFHVLSAHRITGTNPFSVLDEAVEPGRTHIYRITAIDEFGLEEALGSLSTEVLGRPSFIFRAPDPNPVRTSLNLRFYLPPTSMGGDYRIDVLDIAGRQVNRIETGRFTPEGEERVSTWDLRDGVGRRVASGVYLVRLSYRLHGGAGNSSNALVRRVVVLP